jgi:hypothetical protein
MANRIFPSEKQERIASPKELALIDGVRLEEKLRTAGCKCGDKKCETDACVEACGDTVAEKKPWEKKPRTKKELGKCPDCGTDFPCACKVKEAEAAGDTVRLASYRDQRKRRLDGELAAVEGQMGREALAQRSDIRRRVYAGLEALEAELTQEAAVEVKKEKAPDFELATKLSGAKQSAFVRYAEKMGWPKDYAVALVGATKGIKVHAAVREVGDNVDLKPKAKKAIITAMYKASKLKPEQANRIKEYWKDELGYPDIEWIDDLVATPEQ